MPTHEHVGTQLTDQWHDLLIWTVWHERHGRHTGYEAWKDTEIDIAGPKGAERVVPRQVLVGRTEALMDHVRAM